MSDLDKLLKAKAHSDNRDYPAKTTIVRDMAKLDPKAFYIDSEKDGILGLTHKKLKFKLHLPKREIQDLKLSKAASVPLMLKTAVVRVEIADTDEAQRQGLSNRYFMPANHGMLFTKAGSYWMRETYIPLDLVFLTKTGTVLDIQEMPVEPNPKYPTKTYQCRSAEKAAMALELSKGWCRKNNVNIGDQVKVAVK